MYAQREGVPQDYVEADKWFVLAGTNGYEGASKGRMFVEKAMTRGQISEAERRATEWMRVHRK
jgi:uncharacterized protein